MVILEKLEQTIERFKMLEAKDRVVVAVSGGPDSVALVHLLNRLRKKWLIELHLAHLNHCLRENEADTDQLFVKKLAQRLKLPLTCASIEVKNFARENKLSLEEAARKARYEFLLQVAQENQAAKISLGHNLDDQAETVLMRFLRGSGVSGLRGIPATRKLDNCLIIRPLIEIKRKQIIQFLSSKKIPFRIDSSNLNNIFLRNRVRNQLLPLLEKDFNPKIKELLVNLAENLYYDFDFLEQKALEEFKAVCTNRAVNGKVIVNTKKFSSLHQALQKLVVRLAVKKLKGDIRSIDYRHWKELQDLFNNRPQQAIVDLPAGISVAKQAEHLVFYSRSLRQN
ncbi:MAG: tRNA lysidine(34) synthetase TilS [Candidatus Omnitrophica bacterium]|nr:tRNA lysidine(34) synthetase TilS [Candidatus Omnitrophota bacterium]